MRGVPGHRNHAFDTPNVPNARRKPLAPLPDELSGPVRDFVSALRRMHGELGLSLKELEKRLPASRSSLSRYLRGQSLPDERLLVRWCTLSLTGEDRLPALVELLHRAHTAQESGGTARGTEPRATATAQDRGGRRPVRLVAAGLAAAGLVAAVAVTVAALAGAGEDGAGGPDDGAARDTYGSARGVGSARITVENVERACRSGHREECALGLARDPYLPYRRANVTGHVWHGDVLHARCRIADGVTVTDEVGGHSSIWLRVDHGGEQAWLPGIRVRPEQVADSGLPLCPH